MKITEKKERQIIKVQERVINTVCDECKREITNWDDADPFNREKESKYFRVMTGHNDWGNDSCESIHYFDICPDCINNFFKTYIERGGRSSYIEINTKHAYKEDFENEEYE